MSLQRTVKRIILHVILSASILYFGMRFYAQYRHIDIYVTRGAPLPAQLAAGLHMEEHKIDPLVQIESPYDGADDKKLSMEKIRRLRAQIAWSRNISPFIDSLTIESPTRVLARRTTSRVMVEYQLVKKDDHWATESATRSEINRNSTGKN